MDAMDVLNRCRPALPRIVPVGSPDLSKLKRMPHLFCRVLELPLHAETSVTVVESRDCYRFQVHLPGVQVNEVKVEVLEIVPGATKVRVRGFNQDADDVPDVNFWRFRLPPTTVPEKSVANYENDCLSVTIPKVAVSCNDSLQSLGLNDGDSDMDTTETEEERMQRELLEDLESFGSPRRRRSSPRSSISSINSQSSPMKSFESEKSLEKLQQEVLEDLESFGSPRRRSASCTHSLNFQSTGSQDFFRSVGSWVGGFTVSVQ